MLNQGAKFHASVAVRLTLSLFRDLTRRRLVAGCRRFSKAHWSLSRGLNSPRKLFLNCLTRASNQKFWTHSFVLCV